ncbi:MAG: methyltransferase domain-containing protein [Actinobacteria bacterium]|nr:methyltransferase domain-containing protein [Actinomycetota bacterium]
MRPDLPPGIVVLPGTDVEGAWERFEMFEALHHGMRICNPMHGSDLDEVLGHLDPAAGDRMIDIACGHGELLIRAAERAPIEGVGVDLSPWVLARAAGEAASRVPDARLSWWLGDGKALPKEPWDVVTCLGASWIWNGSAGTARALAARSRPGAAVAIGDLILKQGADPAAIRQEYGAVLTQADYARLLAESGFDHLDCMVLPTEAFEAYDRRVAESAAEWAIRHPGPDADRYLEEQRTWAEDHRRDRQFLSWVVWVGRRAGTA